MAFHQNGLTLTLFADQFTAKTATGVESMAFDVVNLLLLIFIVYAAFALFSSKTAKGKSIAGAIILACIGGLVYKYYQLPPVTNIDAPIFQQFNPCFVVGLTPVSIAIFGALAKKGKEPSAPRKIALGMLVAACASFVSPNWLISTYLVLTFGELLLSPMGISFVSKVAPPKYKGLMMGGWFVATAVGNLLVSVGGYLWGSLPVWTVWTVFIALCLISAIFMFSIMKRLEAVC